MQSAFPGVEFLYRFRFLGYDFTTLDTSFDLNHLKMEDEGAAVREILPCMQNCKLLDMDFCGVSSEAMEQIRDEYPQMEVIWRIWFGHDCSVRTDVDHIDDKFKCDLTHHASPRLCNNSPSPDVFPFILIPSSSSSYPGT